MAICVWLLSWMACALVAGLAALEALEIRFDGGGFVRPGISVSPWCSRCCGWARWR
jgi:hypothetical protein